MFNKNRTYSFSIGILSLAIFLHTFSAHAHTVQMLDHEQKPLPEWNDLLYENFDDEVVDSKNMMTDMWLAFGKKRFQVYRLLGGGSSHYIFDIGEGKALRVWQYPIFNNEMDFFLDGHREFKGLLGDNIVKVYPNLSVYSQYTIVEYENIVFRLDQYLNTEIDQLQGHTFKSLLEFLIATNTYFKRIADFKPENIVWNGERWLLIDWDHPHQLNGPLDKIEENIIASINRLLPDFPKAKKYILKELKKIKITKKRHSLNCHKTLLNIQN